MIDFVSELRDEIARLTAERDELLREAESRLKIITLMGVERREMWVAKERAEADLAAARAALLDIQRTVHKHVADRIAEETLARLGTGEALAAFGEIPPP